jgi:hypothetical protein
VERVPPPASVARVIALVSRLVTWERAAIGDLEKARALAGVAG